MSKKRTSKPQKNRKADKYRKIKKEIRLEPRTKGQSKYISLIENNEITICNGPAGSGKTLLAVGSALRLMEKYPNKYRRLIMVRPYVHVQGEDMGYLPGGVDEKMAPFVMPMFDSLDFFLSQSEILTLKDSNTIEIIPVAYLRGRTLNNAIVIFDEAQNSRWEHMRMFLTRIGFDTKAIVEGDISQSDLVDKYKSENGLVVAGSRLEGVKGVGIISLEREDVVRSPIVRRILERL